MSYFATALKKALEETGMSQAELCRVTDIRTGQMSRYVNDTNEPEPDPLNRICAAFSEKMRAQLVIARMRDCIPESAAKLIDLRIATQDETPRLQEDAPPFGKSPYDDLPKDVRDALQFLTEEAKGSREMREAIVAWVNVMRS